MAVVANDNNPGSKKTIAESTPPLFHFVATAEGGMTKMVCVAINGVQHIITPERLAWLKKELGVE